MSTVGEIQVGRRRLPRALPSWAWTMQPAGIFVLLSAIFGSIIVAITPPLRGPDEAAHFLRAYGIAQGDVVASQADAQGRKGIFLAPTFYAQFALFEARHAHERTPFRLAAEDMSGTSAIEPAAPVFVPYTGSEGYAPVPYLPHVAAAFAARVIGLDFLATLYLMRLTGLVVFTLVAAYAVALVPSLKWGFIAIAMLPAALYGRAVVNADGGTLAFAMVVAAMCLRGTAVLRPRQHALWLVLCVLSKPPNIALVALETMRTPMKDLVRFRRTFAAIIGLAVMAALAWAIVSSGDAGAWRLVVLTGQPAEQFDPLWKLRYGLEQPLHFPTAVLATLSESKELWKQLIGVLGLFDTVLQPWVYPALSIGLIATFLTRVDIADRRRAAAVAGAVAIAYALIVFGVFYLVWTPVDAAMIWGVQGRYFIPALPAIAIMVACQIDRGLSERTCATLTIAGSLLSGMACIEAIARVEWWS